MTRTAAPPNTTGSIYTTVRALEEGRGIECGGSGRNPGELWLGFLLGCSGDGFDRTDLRDVFPQVALDAELESHAAGRAADAGAVEPDADETLAGDLDQLKIAAIGLDGRADEVQHAADALVQVGAGSERRGGLHKQMIAGERAKGGGVEL